MKAIILNAIFLASLLWCGCGSSLKLTDASQIVPKEAQRITRIDLKQLNGKLDKKVIQSFQMWDMLREQSGKGKKGVIFKLLSNPQQSGIDFDQYGYWVHDNGRRNLYFLLKKPADFAKMLRETTPKMPVQKSKGVQFTGNDSTVLLAWKGNVAVLSMPASSERFSKIMGKIPQNYTPQSKSSTVIDPVSLFTLSPTRSILTDPLFQKAMIGNHDMATYYKWGNGLSSMLENTLGKDKLGNMSDLTIMGYMDFSNGRMVSHYDYNMPDSFRLQLREYVRPRLETNFERYLHHPNNVLSMVISLNPNGLEKQLTNFDNLLPLPDSAKIIVKEAVKGMLGDVMFSMRLDTAGLHPVLAIPIRSKQLLEQMLAKWVQDKKLTLDNQGVYALVPRVDTAEGSKVGKLPDASVKSEIKTESSDEPEEMPQPSDDMDAPVDTSHYNDPNYGMMEEMPLSPPKKKGLRMQWNRLCWDKDILILTDSLSMSHLQQNAEVSLGTTELGKALSTASFGLDLNLEAAFNSGYSVLSMVRMLVPELPLSGIRIVYNEQGMDTFVSSGKKDENIMMTWLGFANQMSSLLGGLLQEKSAPKEELKEHDR